MDENPYQSPESHDAPPPSRLWQELPDEIHLPPEVPWALIGFLAGTFVVFGFVLCSDTWDCLIFGMESGGTLGGIIGFFHGRHLRLKARRDREQSRD